MRGNAAALQRFIEQALVDRPSLAFESVQLEQFVERIRDVLVRQQHFLELGEVAAHGQCRLGGLGCQRGRLGTRALARLTRARLLEGDDQHPDQQQTEPALPVRSNLAKFEEVLLPHEDIPDALNELFELAAAEKLVLAKGEYRLQIDDSGRFVRYRMALPVRGNAAALQRFIEQALVDRPSLAFESVQLKRERIQSDRVEAQIQWTLIATPATTVAKVVP
ncbi:MAG: hypothetical protein EOO24_54680 [Comamonadaceae bacterium]|nr:MAG: hypothetical protein EOO24_54680 [Comamonadaceae bacterium]